MKKVTLQAIFLPALLLVASCSQTSKNFSEVTTGMTKEQVIEKAGTPSKKSNMGIAEFWVYNESDRAVIFRKDTVYDIITSADARIDSIKSELDETSKSIKENIVNAGDSMEKFGKKLKSKIKIDTAKKDSN